MSSEACELPHCNLVTPGNRGKVSKEDWIFFYFFERPSNLSSLKTIVLTKAYVIFKIQHNSVLDNLVLPSNILIVKMKKKVD